MTTVPWKMADKEERNVFCQQNHTFRPLTSVVSYPERGDGGNNKYRGNCSPKLIEDLIGFFKPAEICDYMCGSGTTADAAKKWGLPVIVMIFTAGLTCWSVRYRNGLRSFLASAILEYYTVCGRDV